MSEITYDDKVDLNVESTIANINKVTASDMNEIKSVVNENAETLDEINVPSNWVKVGDTIPTDGRKVLFQGGKNLFDTNNTKYGTISQSDGETISSNTSVLYTPNYIGVLPNTQYTLSSNVSNISVRLFNYQQNKTYINTSVASTSNTSATFTTSANTYFIRLQFSYTFNNNFQLEQGSSATTYEPYIEQDLIVNGGKFMADQLVSVGATNPNDGRRVWFSKSKNLFNINSTPSKIEQCTASISDNVLTQTNSGQYSRTEWKVTGLEVGKSYSFSCSYSNSSNSSIAVRLYNSANSTQIIGSNNYTNASGTITLTFTATETEIRLRLYSNTTNTTNTYSVSFSQIQLEQGANTSYEPYVDEGIYVDNNLLYCRPKILWQNASPTSSFANQEITLNDNINNYKYYEIITNLTTSYATMVFSTGWLPTSYNQTRLSVPRQYLGNRSVSINQNKITFGHYEQYSTYGQTTASNNDGTCVPLLVLGYK